jgi:hypothetical protein
MKIGLCFFGIMYREYYTPNDLTARSDKDFRHCYPNIKKMLIDPFIEQGHEVINYAVTYPIEDKEIEKEFYEMIKPKKVLFIEYEGSDSFSPKGASCGLLENETDLDVVMLTRPDLHWSKKVAEYPIDFSKFNFLFKEGDGWWERARFLNDNLYIFPFSMLKQVQSAIFDTYTWPRGKPYVDTHGLIHKLMNYIQLEQMNIISPEIEVSDVNSFYTCCRRGLPLDGRGGHIHPEVKERYGYK